MALPWPTFETWNRIRKDDRAARSDVLTELLAHGALLGGAGRDRELYLMTRVKPRKLKRLYDSRDTILETVHSKYLKTARSAKSSRAAKSRSARAASGSRSEWKARPTSRRRHGDDRHAHGGRCARRTFPARIHAHNLVLVISSRQTDH